MPSNKHPKISIFQSYTNLEGKKKMKNPNFIYFANNLG